MVEGMGSRERRRALEWYLTGLLLDGERKSVAPMVARLEEEGEVYSMRQRLQKCVSRADWSDSEVRQPLARKQEGELPGVAAFVVDDTGFPKKGGSFGERGASVPGNPGPHGQLPEAVSLHLAGDKGSGCIGMRLYLSEDWTRDSRRRAAAGVPNQVHFERKWEIALGQLDEALEWGVKPHVVLADAGYGDAREFREALHQRGLHYLVGVQGNHKVWPPGAQPQQPA